MGCPELWGHSGKNTSWLALLTQTIPSFLEIPLPTCYEVLIHSFRCLLLLLINRNSFSRQVYAIVVTQRLYCAMSATNKINGVIVRQAISFTELLSRCTLEAYDPHKPVARARVLPVVCKHMTDNNKERLLTTNTSVWSDLKLKKKWWSFLTVDEDWTIVRNNPPLIAIIFRQFYNCDSVCSYFFQGPLPLF